MCVCERERERCVQMCQLEQQRMNVCHYFLKCVFACAQVCVVNKKMSGKVYMDEACDMNELMSQTDR